jgi:hypothetical protein
METFKEGDLVRFKFQSKELGLIEFIRYPWYYVEWESGIKSESWYPCKWDEIELVESSD